ncbi:MAG: PTS sugar transporter subunit IIC [Brevinema sp.]
MDTSKIDAIVHVAGKIFTSKPILAIKDGIILTLPLTIVGSIFLLIGNLPIPGYTDFMAIFFGQDWDKGLYQIVGSTFDLLALIAVFGVSYTYVQNEKIYAVPAGILAIVCFFIVNNHFISVDSEVISGVFPKEFLGGKGMIGSIIIGLFVGYIYTLCLKNNLKISLPDGVPTAVASVFTSLIPFMIVMTTTMVIYNIFQFFTSSTLLDVIYNFLQQPLQGISSSLFGAFAIPVLISLLWWMGIHGSAIVSGILTPVLMANAIANQKVIEASETLISGTNSYIVTIQYLDQYITVTGAGFTLGLVLLMLHAKSTHFKSLSKISLLPGIFNINEPILFGIPIVLNPYMFIPFILAPLASSLIVYTSISVGFLAPFGSIVVPWTTPIIIGGFLVGGWQGALVQTISLIVATLIYFPFFKIIDRQAYLEEQKNK